MVTITKEEYDRLHAVAASSGIREHQEPAPRLLAGPKWGWHHGPADAVDSAAPPACAPWPKAKPMPGQQADGEHDTGAAAEYCEYGGVAAQPSTASTTGDCGGEVEPNVGDAYDDRGWDEGGTAHKRRRQHSMDDDAKVPWLKQQLSKVEELLSDAGVIVMKAVQHTGEDHVAPVLLEDEVSGIPPTVRTEKMKRGGRHVRIARIMAKHVANGGDLNAVRQSADRNVHKYIEWLFQNHWNEFEEFGSAQVVWDCLRWGAS
ncbi:unnamed protein product [Prorocentrum cordatum]|uniref:Uncharacterized protein n=1 Tax=Prorocentrum cordatum TaxID=2364126 RepID=A0ABN9THD0_9DINO|nr:unnamed protein product [Polarella glacialis]